MNIKEHIEAGHYSVDEKGRALVPMVGGLIATILATDMPGDCPIVGWYDDNSPENWSDTGRFLLGAPDTMDLLPPPPRKETKRAWIVYPKADDGEPCWGLPQVVYDNPHEPESYFGEKTCVVVEMSCEREEPWS